MKVSVVIPTKNNETVLDNCLQSIQCQDYPHDQYEVIIVDGHSIDRTISIAEQYGTRVISDIGGTIGAARNIGVRMAQGLYIAFTDADCRVTEHWLKTLVSTIEEADPRVAAVGGPNLTPSDDTQLAQQIGAFFTMLSPFGVRYGFEGTQAIDIYHNPTCNVIYRKDVFTSFGGFNPTLVSCDDEELDHRLRAHGYRIQYTPQAIVYHARRTSWQRFITMAYNYGIGRMQVVKLHPDMARWFHFLPLALGLIMVAILGIGVFTDFPHLILILIGLVLGGTLGVVALTLYLRQVTQIELSISNAITLLTLWLTGFSLGLLRGVYAPTNTRARKQS